MPFAVEFEKSAQRALYKLNPENRKRILRYISSRLSQSDDPRSLGGSLVGESSGFWKYRVGDYRLIARIEDERLVILVVKIGHRREVHR